MVATHHYWWNIFLNVCLLIQVKEETTPSTEETPAPEQSDDQSQIDIESLRSLSDVGIDMSFLDDYGVYYIIIYVIIVNLD